MTKERWALQAVRPMTDEEFNLWQALIEARVGMTMGAARRSFLGTSLSLRMRELGMQDYGAYYERMVQGSGSAAEPEWAVLVDRLTVQETSFFRHQPSYDCYGRHIESLLHEPARRQINIWSVGCSTGEEPYSLAMQLQVQLEQAARSDIYWGITASDISLPTLAKARRGIYGSRRCQQIPENLMSRFFQPAGRDQFQIQASVRERICFVQINVMELENAPIYGVDVIFCQNVLIYFKRFRKRDIVGRLVDRLAPGGLLILGVNEMVDWQHPHLDRVNDAGVLAFRRRITI
ncbi:MAG: protein-glutamate O-methyltransferase CheR [Pseudomonadales bacterium]|nr:protein-glutamate O-methyltransferase CheR [Pseudomonadales bacterium]